MGIVRAQVAFDHTSALPADRAINVFHFETVGAPLTADYDAIDDALVDYYNTVSGTGGMSIVSRLSRDLAGTYTIRQYDLADPLPRVVRHQESHSFTPASTDNALPREVALVASFRAVASPGANMRRRRGRVYLGPLNGTANTSNGTPLTGLRTAVVAAGVRLRDNSATTWGIYSPTDNAIYPVYQVWCDNAFDTQRRRGEKATSRLQDPA